MIFVAEVCSICFDWVDTIFCTTRMDRGETKSVLVVVLFLLKPLFSLTTLSHHWPSYGRTFQEPSPQFFSALGYTLLLCLIWNSVYINLHLHHLQFIDQFVVYYCNISPFGLDLFTELIIRPIISLFVDDNIN